MTKNFEYKLLEALNKIAARRSGAIYAIRPSDVTISNAEVLKTAESLDPEELALKIAGNIDECGIMELVDEVVRDAILDMLAENAVEMLKNGRVQEELHA